MSIINSLPKNETSNVITWNVTGTTQHSTAITTFTQAAGPCSVILNIWPDGHTFGSNDIIPDNPYVGLYIVNTSVSSDLKNSLINSMNKSSYPDINIGNFNPQLFCDGKLGDIKQYIIEENDLLNCYPITGFTNTGTLTKPIITMSVSTEPVAIGNSYTIIGTINHPISAFTKNVTITSGTNRVNLQLTPTGNTGSSTTYAPEFYISVPTWDGNSEDCVNITGTISYSDGSSTGNVNFDVSAGGTSSNLLSSLGTISTANTVTINVSNTNFACKCNTGSATEVCSSQSSIGVTTITNSNSPYTAVLHGSC